MLHYDRIDLQEGIDLTKSKNSKEFILIMDECILIKIMFVMVAWFDNIPS